MTEKQFPNHEVQYQDLRRIRYVILTYNFGIWKLHEIKR